MRMFESNNVASNLYLFLGGSEGNFDLLQNLRLLSSFRERTEGCRYDLFFELDKIIHTTDMELQYYFLKKLKYSKFCDYHYLTRVEATIIAQN